WIRAHVLRDDPWICIDLGGQLDKHFGRTISRQADSLVLLSRTATIRERAAPCHPHAEAGIIDMRKEKVSYRHVRLKEWRSRVIEHRLISHPIISAKIECTRIWQRRSIFGNDRFLIDRR